MMSYEVYTAEYYGEPNHVAIYVETEKAHGGRLFHVTGNILNGMMYETKVGKNPTESVTHVPGTMVRIGQVSQTNMSRFEAVCEAVEPPGAQLRLNGKPKDASKPIRRCGEWVQEVREKLIADGVMTN